ncbi:MAG: tripartite tricarboxylate transporter TctB family protein [Smithellaceae bacterium]|nr:tripartite tricarboxylate transporter TctB family protein [Smithellaceae bacterium]
MIKSKGELFFLLFILLGSFILFGETFYFKGSEDIGGRLGPAFWPRMLLVGIMIICVSLLVEYLIKRGRMTETMKPRLDLRQLRFLIAVGLITAYLLLLPLVGFIIITPLFMIAFMYLLGEPSKAWILGVSLVLTAIIVVLFTKAMYVPLPRGQGIFLQFSQIFY